MKYGPRKTAELVAKATEMRATGLKWGTIARQLKLTVGWIKWHTGKAGHIRYDQDRLKTSPANLAKARELRAAGVPWKLVERQMGIPARTLERAITKQDKAARDGD